jgi:3-hydroxybutyryl-CoA dehydrogenase
MPEIWTPGGTPAAVAGLGLMGSSISACLLAAGHSVVGIETNGERRRTAGRRTASLLRQMREEGLLQQPVQAVMERFRAAKSMDELHGSRLVVEAIVEDGEQKRRLLHDVEAVVDRTALIGCNTSAIPISHLQSGARHPKRIIGIHWAEPAHITRFLEVVCGDSTSPAAARRIVALSRAWGKEPTLVRRDIRGFITNRCFYALLREAMYLVDNGYASVADVDRSLRNDLGYWITFAGPFRFMDLTGVPAYAAVARDLFPELANSASVPPVLAKLAASGAEGVRNQRGFYRYSRKQAADWEKRFHQFSYEIRALASRYPEDPTGGPAPRAQKGRKP